MGDRNLEQRRRPKKKSQRDRELHPRHEQSARDRERYQRDQSRAFHQLSQRLTQSIAIINVGQPSASNFVSSRPPDTETMTPTLPWKQDASSGKAFGSSFNNKKYSDFTLYLGESKTPFPAHRLVLGICNPFFDNALQSKFKEGITYEFTFDKDSPQALWRVLQFMYTGDYADESSDSLHSEDDNFELLKHPRVYALADMFWMEDLKRLSGIKFELQLKQHWISDTLFDCIRKVYSSSTESSSSELRKAVVKTACLHKNELVQKRPFQELIREVGDFAVDLVLGVALNNY